MQRASTVIEPIEEDLSPEAAFAAFGQSAQDAGFAGAALSDLMSRDPFVASTLAEDYVRQFREERLHDVDPVADHAWQTSIPFTARAYIETAAPAIRRAGKRRIEVMSFHGYSDMLAIPIHGSSPRRVTCYLAELYWKGAPDAFAKAVDRSGRLLHLSAVITSEAHECATLAAAPTDAAALSGREIDCLSLCARGKTSSETAAILGIRESTVNFHISKAMARLNVTSRIHAVSRAMALRLVQY